MLAKKSTVRQIKKKKKTSKISLTEYIKEKTDYWSLNGGGGTKASNQDKDIIIIIVVVV